jgi:hypothetical protein
MTAETWMTYIDNGGKNMLQVPSKHNECISRQKYLSIDTYGRSMRKLLSNAKKKVLSKALGVNASIQKRNKTEPFKLLAYIWFRGAKYVSTRRQYVGCV